MVRGRDSPLGLQRGRPAGAHVPPRRSQTQGAKGCSRPASPRRSSYPKTATWTVQGSMTSARNGDVASVATFDRGAW